MSTLDNLYLKSEIVGHEVTETRLLLNTSDGSRFSIPLGMLGYFQEPYAPDEEAELLILSAAPKVKDVHVTDERLDVHLNDGRLLSVPLKWFPRLVYGTPKERQAVEIWDDDCLHWEVLDEDISVTALFKMTGPSAESEASIQRWLDKRRHKALSSSDTEKGDG
jgi:hypothetical protein